MNTDESSLESLERAQLDGSKLVKRVRERMLKRSRLLDVPIAESIAPAELSIYNTNKGDGRHGDLGPRTGADQLCTTGVFQTDVGGRRDAISGYLVAMFFDGYKLEAWVAKESPRQLIIARNDQCWIRMKGDFNLWEPLHNEGQEWHASCGEMTVTARFGFEGGSRFIRWDKRVRLVFGSGERVEIVLVYPQGIRVLLRALWRLVTLRFITTPPPPNNRVMFRTDDNLDDKQAEIALALSACFRFMLDDGIYGMNT